VLRQYGSFTLNILNDTARGNELLAKADDIERRRQVALQKGTQNRSSASQMHSTSSVLFNDDTGMLVNECKFALPTYQMNSKAQASCICAFVQVC